MIIGEIACQLFPCSCSVRSLGFLGALLNIEVRIELFYMRWIAKERVHLFW